MLQDYILHAHGLAPVPFALLVFGDHQAPQVCRVRWITLFKAGAFDLVVNHCDQSNRGFTGPKATQPTPKVHNEIVPPSLNLVLPNPIDQL